MNVFNGTENFLSKYICIALFCSFSTATFAEDCIDSATLNWGDINNSQYYLCKYGSVTVAKLPQKLNQNLSFKVGASKDVNYQIAIKAIGSASVSVTTPWLTLCPKNSGCTITVMSGASDSGAIRIGTGSSESIILIISKP